MFAVYQQLPDTGMPEVAFAGNPMWGNPPDQRSDEPEVSGPHQRTAGQTQTINFYKINGERYLVDLPGYGYARVSQAEKEKWGKMIEKYLHTSKI